MPKILVLALPLLRGRSDVGTVGGGLLRGARLFLGDRFGHLFSRVAAPDGRR